ncbi:MAG: NAD(P)-dependent oxidoreductase, partial [Nitrososphaerota archaeon]
DVVHYGRAEPEQLRRAEVLVTFRLSREDLEMMPNLKVIQILSAGVDHLDWSSIPEDVVVCSNAGSNAVPVAEHAIALLLAAAKRIPYYHERCRSGDFSRDKTVKVLQGSVIAVLGLGPIGMRVAELAKALGMRVRGFARRPRSEPFIDEFRAYPDVRGALSGAEFAVLALPLNRHTKNMIGYEELRAMRSDGVMVNVGRGGVVSKPDLIRFLRDNPDFTYATDVYWSGDIS